MLQEDLTLEEVSSLIYYIHLPENNTSSKLLDILKLVLDILCNVSYNFTSTKGTLG